MSSKDLLVIGGGPAGLTSALRGADKGLDVVLVEKEEFGGVCLNRGCIPSKSLATVSDTAYYSGNSQEMGIESNVEVDYEKVVSWSKSNINHTVSSCRKMLKGAGVEIKESEASFVSSSEAKAGGENIEFEKAVIATGSAPAELPNIEVTHDRIINSDDFFSLTSLPERMVILGAGYIGMEIGTICAKLGSDVIVVEMMDQILPHFDKRIVKPVARKAKKIGVDVNLGLKVTEVESENEVTLKAESKDSEERRFSGDKCLVSVGRTPRTEGLGLDSTEVTLDEKGFVETNESFLTEDSNIYAVGDVAGGKMLAHEAYHDATVAIDDILGESSESASVPEVVFTDPQIAEVGEFKEEYDTGKVSFRAVAAAYTKNRVEGFIQIAVDEEGILKGGRIVGHHASEMIHELGLAIENELSAKDIVQTIHAHPTLSEGIARAAEDAMGLSPTGC